MIKFQMLSLWLQRLTAQHQSPSTTVLGPGEMPSEERREGRHCYNTIYGSASSNSSSQCADLASPSSEPLAHAHQRKLVTPSPLELGPEPGRASRQSPNEKGVDCPSTNGKLEPGTPRSDCALQAAMETQRHESWAPSALLKHCRPASKHPWPQAQARSEHSLRSGCLRLAKGALLGQSHPGAASCTGATRQYQN